MKHSNMIRIFATITLFVIALPAIADVISNEKTSLPNGSRYEIVQSAITMRDTYRLDRYSGKVCQLVEDKQGNLVWEEMIVQGRPAISNPSIARFQLFLSGMAAKGTYLIDNQTGRTWQVQVVHPNDEQEVEQTFSVWVPIGESSLQ